MYLSIIQKEKKELQKQVVKILEDLDGKDLSHTTDLYQKAFDLFIQGKTDKALLILDDTKLEAEERKIKEDIKHKAETRLLKARMLKIKNKYNEAGTNYEKAVELYPGWNNCLETAIYFSFINEYFKAEKYYK